MRAHQANHHTNPNTLGSCPHYVGVRRCQINGLGLPLQCLGLGSYVQLQAFTLSAPVIVAAAVVIWCVVGSCVKRGDPQPMSEKVRNGLLAALPWLLILSFLVYPRVSSSSFRGAPLSNSRQSTPGVEHVAPFLCAAFSCETFDDGRSFLRAE